MKRAVWFTCLLILVPSIALAEKAVDGPLARYVAKQDASYGWTKRRSGSLGQGSYVELTLTSQTWRGYAWKHQLFVIKPSSIAADAQHALLFITGGSWNDRLERPTGDHRLPGQANLFGVLAEQMKTPVAVLLQVPHQPLFDGKKEDQIIALTFDRFLQTGDAEWPLLLPMVKSAVRGMDAVQELARDHWSLDLKTFTVTGASKRGWTTWLTGAVDPRVTAIAPMVIDMLNMQKHIEHQKEAWGDFSYKIHDYTERGLHQQLSSEAGRALQAIVDPYHYRQALTQPKLIIIGTNDHYWPLDALNLYWRDLLGPKYILYVPNNRHGLEDIGRLSGSLNAIHQHAARGIRLPMLDWSFARVDDHLSLHVKSDQPTQMVQAWVAASDDRDFRQARWQSHSCQANGGGFDYRLKIPDKGWVALFGEAVFEGFGGSYFLSTTVQLARRAN